MTDIGTKFTWLFSGAFLVVLVLILIFLYPEYKLNKKKLQRKRVQNSGNTPQSKKGTYLGVIFYFLFWLLIPFGIFLLSKLVVNKITSGLKEITGIDIPDYVWFAVLVLLFIWAIWYFRGHINKKVSSININMPSLKLKWLWWIPVLIGLYFAGRWGYKEFFLKPKISERYWSKPDWVQVRQPVKDVKIFDLEKQNKMTPGDRLKFEQKDPKNMLHFAPANSDTIVYTIVKREDRSRYWSVMVWTKGDTLFENRLTNEPYDKAKVGDSEISVDRPSTIVVWKKKVKVL